MESIQSTQNAVLVVEGTIKAKAQTDDDTGWISTQDKGVPSEN